MTAIDPITTQVIANRLLGLAEEMSIILMRASYSPNIKERADCSTAVFDVDGRVIAQAQRIPIHLGSMLRAIHTLAGRTCVPGDMFLANDPYVGAGQHLPDINVIAPVFDGETLIGYVANIAHHSDVGGMLPGSEAAACRTIFQEGLRLPLVRIVRAGEVDRDLLDIIALNSRRPRDRHGDLRAQFAANHIGIRGMLDLNRAYGADVMAAAMKSYLAYTGRRFRAAVGAIEDGTYSAEDWLDQDEDGSDPVPLRVTLTVRGDTLTFDFSGTGPQLATSRNVPFSGLQATVYSVCKSLIDPSLPPNDGYYSAIQITAPEGSLLNPVAPGAVGVRALTCAVVGDLIAAAISRALPGRALAGCGPHAQYVLSGRDPESSEFYVDYETVAGAIGARPTHDGMDAVRVHASGASNLPVESLEHAFPVRVERYELRDDSGGDGRYRGGLGVRRDYRIQVTSTVSVSAERQRIQPRGIADGRGGAVGSFRVNGNPIPAAAAEYPLQPGDLFSVLTPGGGGFGDPALREEKVRQRDRIEGRVTTAPAAENLIQS